VTSGWLTGLLARRLLTLVPLLLILSLAVFALLQLVPGGPERALLSGRPATPEVLASIRARYGLDDPLHVQYLNWLAGVLRLDFGRSILTSQLVTDAILSRAGLTVLLGLYAFLITVLIGLPLGIVAALRRNGTTDRTITGLSVVGVSAPAFATGILLIYVFAVVLRLMPSFGPGRGLPDQIVHLTLPAIALAFGSLALLVKVTRSAMAEELDKDYVAFARARGLRSRKVVLQYGLRNALVPVMTAAGIVFIHMITGAVLVEVTFALPGLGTLLVDSVQAVDIPIVQGLVIVIAVFIVIVHLGIDVLYGVIDPRIRFGHSPE
jgi:peptide/nickel transport system permease protein